jgi:hypothetical protein
MELTSLIVIAILVEAIWENIKTVWEDGININRIGALVLAILVSILAKVDVFAMVGITLTIPVVSYVLTGIVVSRGANFVNDLFGKLRGE